MKKNNFSIIAFFSTIFWLFFSSASNSQQSENPSIDSAENQIELNIENSNQNHSSSIAVIQGLNKITAKSSLIEIKINQAADFGKLRIKAFKCWKAPLDQKPENKILIEVLDSSNLDEEIIGEKIDKKKSGENKFKRIFFGWIFSSSPSISGIEHPIYDITAINCK